MGVKAATFDLGGHNSARDSRWDTATKVVPDTAFLILETQNKKTQTPNFQRGNKEQTMPTNISLWKEGEQEIYDSGLHQS